VRAVERPFGWRVQCGPWREQADHLCQCLGDEISQQTIRRVLQVFRLFSARIWADRFVA
jgi:hypothetical protein